MRNVVQFTIRYAVVYMKYRKTRFERFVDYNFPLLWDVTKTYFRYITVDMRNSEKVKKTTCILAMILAKM